MRWLAVLVLGLATHGPVFAAEMTSPEFLRENHAGIREFTSEQPVETLYPMLRDAAQTCWVGRVAMGLGTGATGGALGTMQSASWEIESEVSPDGNSAYVMILAKGAFRFMHASMLQIDLREQPGGTLVTAYHGSNVRAQRQFLDEVQHWLAGHPEFCHPKLGMERKRGAAP